VQWATALASLRPWPACRAGTLAPALAAKQMLV
jgi:hypothetical protein